MDELDSIGARPDPRAAVLDRVVRHIESEYTNDLDVIMPTVSRRDVFFPLVSTRPDGSYEVAVFSDYPGAISFYEESRRIYDVVSSTHMIRVTTDWYTLDCPVGVLRLHEHVGPGAEGLVVANPAAVIFPVADDGIVGEIVWARDDFTASWQAAKAGNPLPLELDLPRQMANTEQLWAYLAACRAGDASAVERLLADHCCLATKVVTAEHDTVDVRTSTDRTEICTQLTRSGAQRIDVVSQIVTDFYAFVEYRIVRSDGGIRRTVALHPFDEASRLVGELSYTVDH